MGAVERVIRAYAELPDDPDAIADHLRDAGIRTTIADICDSTSCAMARYLLSLDGVEGIAVGPWETRIYAAAFDRDTRPLERPPMLGRIDTPDAVGTFVGRFDNGWYAALMDTQEPTHAR